MTRRERRYLFIIAALTLQQQRLIESTNAHIEAMEDQANRLIDELRQKQVEADQQKINTVLETAEILWQETQKPPKVQSKRRLAKEAKRLRQGEQ